MQKFTVKSVSPGGQLGDSLIKPTSHKEATNWAIVYRNKYIGKPYPNGKGHYPWTDFKVVKV